MLDIEATLSDVLRADPQVSARIGDRCWLTLPSSDSGLLVFPALWLTRVTGSPSVAYNGAFLYDDAQVDLHAYGGSRAEAHGLAMDAISALVAATHTIGVQLFGIQRFPDPDVPAETGRDRERYIVSIRAFGTP